MAFSSSQEIGSYMLKYIENLKVKPRHLIAWSDSCGDQNKNIFRLWMYILMKYPEPQTVHHKFLVPSHSFLQNDADFGIIKKYKQSIIVAYSPSELAELIQVANKFYHVLQNNSNDFLILKGNQGVVLKCQI